MKICEFGDYHFGARNECCGVGAGAGSHHRALSDVREHPRGVHVLLRELRRVQGRDALRVAECGIRGFIDGGLLAGSEFRVAGRLQVQDSGFRIQDSGLRIRVSDLESRDSGWFTVGG